jgi:hypothetical protein
LLPSEQLDIIAQQCVERSWRKSEARLARPLALVLAAIFGSGGCSSATEPPAFLGAYHAVAVNGAPLPAPLGPNTIVTAGSVELSSDGTYLLSIATRDATNPAIVGNEVVSGLWTDAGGTIILHFDVTPAVSATATYAGDQLSVRRAENVYTFQRN